MECGSCGASIGDPPVECPECQAYHEGGDGPGLPSWLTGEYTPLGIKILCLLELLGAVLLLDVGGNIRRAGLFTGDSFVATLGLIVILFAVLNLAKIVGLWSLQAWGYKLAVVLYAISFFLGILMIFAEPTAGIVYAVVYGVLWMYLHSRRRFYGIY